MFIRKIYSFSSKFTSNLASYNNLVNGAKPIIFHEYIY